MNRFIVTICFFLTSIAKGFSQEPSSVLTLNEDKSYSYEKVFEVPNKSKDQIFDAIKIWVIKNIKTQANTNFFDENTKSTITTNPAFTSALNSWVEFKLNLEIKDGKYRLSANSFIWHNMQGIGKNLGDYSGITMNKKNRMKVLADVDAAFNSILTSIETAVNSKSDW